MPLDNCIITGLPLTSKFQIETIDNKRAWVYTIIINGEHKSVHVCESLVNAIGWDIEITKSLEENRILIIGELAKNEFTGLNQLFHWDCTIKGERHINLKQYLNDLKSKADYPITRKEKIDNLLKYLHKAQSFEGSEITIGGEITLYGKLYFLSFQEMQFYIRELQRKGLIDYNEGSSKIQFTFYGLEYVDTLKKSSDFDMNTFSKPQYQIALSFAGENRTYVDEVANELIKLGVSVFYDNYEQVDLWGKDLYQHLNDVYKNKCEYCIIFISQHYAEKLWTIHELKSAQSRAFKENKEYILPVRFDDTVLPGENSTVGYLDCNKISPIDLALLAQRKVTHS